MAEYISRDDAEKALLERCKETGYGGLTPDDIRLVMRTPWRIPAADVVERKRGKWIYQFHEDEVGVTCSECEGYAESFARWIYDEGYRVTHNYCPNCGAMMEES